MEKENQDISTAQEQSEVTDAAIEDKQTAQMGNMLKKEKRKKEKHIDCTCGDCCYCFSAESLWGR